MNSHLVTRIFIGVFFTATIAIADDDTPQPTTRALNEQTIIKLDTETQLASGIETATLKATKHQTEIITYGKAISIQPLLELRTRYLMALTDRSRAIAKFKQTEQNTKRQQDLYEHGAASKRHLQDQQAQWQADKAQLDASQFQDQAIVNEATLTWGRKLTEWALFTNTDELNAFLTGRKTLLQITLPSNRQIEGSEQTIYIETSGERSKAQKAELISPAPQTDSNAQGASYFFQTSGNAIRPGMNLSAWIPEAKQHLSGVIIPKSAVCWSMDQAFVYIKTDQETFSRRPINTYLTTADGYFVEHDLKPDEQIVTVGAQILLSEEMRQQIPDED